MSVEISKLVIKVGESEYKFSEAEARELYAALGRLFGQHDFVWPIPGVWYTIPMNPGEKPDTGIKVTC